MQDWLKTTLGKKPDQTFIKRFWDKVDVRGDKECWEWKAFVHPRGYGKFQVKHARPAPAHRVAYSLSIGPVSKDALVCHSCDNRKCCNPKHLFLGTPQSNMDDMIAKGRQKHPPNYGERNGFSKLKEQDILYIRENYGTVPTYKIAEVLGVHRDTIRLAAKGITWKSVT